MIQAKEWLTLKEAALLLNVSPLPLRRWVLAGKVSSEIESPGFKRINRQSEYRLSRIHSDKLNLNERRPNKPVSRIHTDKISDNLFYYLKDAGLANKGEGDWFYFERTTALIYMSLLAKYLARIDKAQTIIGTDVKTYEKLNFQKVDADKGFPVIGMTEASRKLVEKSAANGRSLVISEDGEVKKIPAKELLPRVSGKR